MLAYIWKFKYFIFAVVLVIFSYSLYLISNPVIFFETERILKYADDIEIELSQSFDDKNLFLIGVEFNDEINFNQFVDIDSVYNIIKKDSIIKNEKSVFNESRLLFTGLFFHTINLLNLKSQLTFEKSVKKIKNKSSQFLSKDFKKLFFLIEIKNGFNDKDWKYFISNIRNSFALDGVDDVFVSGQISSEIYMQEKVISELIFITIFSALFCCLILWFFTLNIKFVLLTLISVIFSVVISISMSQFIYGGIELVMIIMPAIIFIVCVSDLMHLLNEDNISTENKKDYFIKKVKIVGIPVALTSFTTAIGFLSFCFSDVLPITRFGLITTVGILISLFIILISYAISVDLNFHLLKGNPKLNKKLDGLIFSIVNFSNKFYFRLILIVMILFAGYGVHKISVDNYITDEVNKKSRLFEEMNFFNENFGGIKPLTFKINMDEQVDISKIIKFENFLDSNGFVLDFSISRFVDNPSLIDKRTFKSLTKDVYTIRARMKDIGSKVSFEKITMIKEKAISLGVPLSVGGAGYLFDQVSNKLTKEILYGLIIAILTIGLLFIIINNFNFRYFFIALIPNVFPILVCIGILCLNNFYFSLSNAFIFAIVFGLIVDDSIHILSSYRFNVKRGMTKDEALDKSLTITARAVIKTTIIVIFSLIPLIFSEFKSVSQLSVITIISAVIAIIFDLVYLPKLMKKYL